VHPQLSKKKGFHSKQEWFYWMVETLPEESREKVRSLIQNYGAKYKTSNASHQTSLLGGK